MGKSKRVDKYPYAYSALVEEVDSSGEMILHFEEKKQAESYRFDLYGFVTALAHEGNMLAKPAARMKLRIQVALAGGYDLICQSSLDDGINKQILDAIAKKNTGAQAHTDSPEREENEALAPDGTPWQSYHRRFPSETGNKWLALHGYPSTLEQVSPETLGGEEKPPPTSPAPDSEYEDKGADTLAGLGYTSQRKESND